MKKSLVLISLIFVLVLSLALVAACSEKPVEFAQSEFEISNGDSVLFTGKKAVIRLLTPVDGVSVDESGKFTVSSDIADCSQVVVGITVDGVVVDTAVCRLHTATASPEISITNISNYIVSGDMVTAVTTPAYSVTYSLKEDYTGISINSVSGKVHFTSKVADGVEFTVVAQAKDVVVERIFRTAVGNYVTAQETVQISEYGNARDVSFVLDFANNKFAESAGVRDVMRGNNSLGKDNWSYDSATKTVTISAKYLNGLSLGENALKIVTAKNSVNVTVRLATYISTPEQLAAINNSREALKGYYIMVCDIDLTDYLAPGGEGYHNGKGWDPIGTYFDVLDGTATDWAFAGTFDGNGHVVKGFYINRSDEKGYNSGLFGYITPQAEIKNLGVINAPGRVNNVRSYSGGFVGVNAGKISNCWANVTISAEGMKVLGGFVGRNEGEIINCYSLGSVSGSESVGCFAGMSKTDVAEGVCVNCYAVQTGEYPFTDIYNHQTNKVVANVAALRQEDFSAYSDAWIVSQGALPVLKSVELEYDLCQLKITNTETYITRGDTIQLTAVTNPAGKVEELGVKYYVIEGDESCVSIDGLVSTRQMQQGCNHFKIKAVCGNFEAFYEFNVYERISQVVFKDSMESTMYAGCYYYIDVAVLPSDANQLVSFKITQPHIGVTLNNGVISVSPYVSNGEFTIEATAVNGTKVSKTIQVVANQTFANNYAIVYRGETQSVSFALPEGVGEKLAKVTRYDKVVEYQLNLDVVTISSQYFLEFALNDIPVKFITTEGTVYTATVVAYDKSTVLTIGSVEEFMAFKNGIDQNPELLAKTIILTADLDFGGIKMTSVGNHHQGKDLVGVFNGNGHTISNLTITANDFSGEYDSEEGIRREDETLFPYHTSRYNVGLFSYVSGVVTNVHFQNVTIAPRFTGEYTRPDGKTVSFQNEPIGNLIGVVTGTNAGTISNCTFTGCSVSGRGDDKGIVCGKNSGTVNNCVVDDKLYIG